MDGNMLSGASEPKSNKRALLKDFDAVIMLTGSDWNREPRSNRYHYATRFARHLPVYFVQKTSRDAPLESTELYNLTIVHSGSEFGIEHAEKLQEVFATLGVCRPLLFVYKAEYIDFIAANATNYIIYHATESYLHPDFNCSEVQRDRIKRVLRVVDLLVAVSDGVMENYRDRGGYVGPSLVLKNGCDFDFWRDSCDTAFEPQESGRPTAIYQGGINSRLDFGLLTELVGNMPDWDFIFCGRSSDEPEWLTVREHANVHYLGEVQPEQIAAAAKNSSVGLIPFKDRPWIRASLPLKAFEYVACGLPVVSTPIDELERYPKLFSLAASAREFESKLRGLAPTRACPDAVRHRQAASADQSYDGRFSELERFLTEQRELTRMVEVPAKALEGMRIRDHLSREMIVSLKDRAERRKTRVARLEAALKRAKAKIDDLAQLRLKSRAKRFVARVFGASAVARFRHAWLNRLRRYQI